MKHDRNRFWLVASIIQNLRDQSDEGKFRIMEVENITTCSHLSFSSKSKHAANVRFQDQQRGQQPGFISTICFISLFHDFMTLLSRSIQTVSGS